MSEKTSLHHILVPNDLIPHEANALNLMLLDATRNMWMNVNISLVVCFGIVDYDLTFIDRPSLVIEC